MKEKHHTELRVQRRHDPGLFHQLTLRYIRRKPLWRFWERSTPLSTQWLEGQRQLAD